MPDGIFSAEQPFFLGAVRVEPRSNEIRFDGRAIRIERRLMVVLTELAVHAGRAATREVLLNAAWGDEAADEALTLAISRLRRALGAHAGLIATVPKIGYRLTQTPAAADDESALPLPAARNRRSFARPAMLAAATVFGIWIGIYGAVWAHRDDFRDLKDWKASAQQTL